MLSTRLLLFASLLVLPIVPFATAQTVKRSEQHEIKLIRGLDGAAYEPYKPSVIEHVQTLLKRLNLYAGEITGQLNEDTMSAIGAVQQEYGLTVSGIPSPRTRERLQHAEMRH